MSLLISADSMQMGSFLENNFWCNTLKNVDTICLSEEFCHLNWGLSPYTAMFNKNFLLLHFKPFSVWFPEHSFYKYLDLFFGARLLSNVSFKIFASTYCTLTIIEVFFFSSLWDQSCPILDAMFSSVSQSFSIASLPKYIYSLFSLVLFFESGFLFCIYPRWFHVVLNPWLL